MPRRATSGLALCAVFALLAMFAVPGVRAAAGPAQPVTLQAVLDRLGSYLSDYAARLPATVASEHYVQMSSDGLKNAGTTLDSDFAVVRLSGVKPWIGFRDVLKVDGRPV